MELDKDSVERFRAGDGVCPFCGGEVETERGQKDDDDIGIYVQPYWCLSEGCEREWECTYTLTSIEETTEVFDED